MHKLDVTFASGLELRMTAHSWSFVAGSLFLYNAKGEPQLVHGVSSVRSVQE